MRCIYCGFVNVEGATTCSSCQRSLATIVINQPGGLAAILAAANAAPSPATPNPAPTTPATAVQASSKQLEEATQPAEKDEVELPNWMSGAPPPPPTPWSTFDLDALADASVGKPETKKPQRGHLNLDTLLPANAETTQEVFAEAIRRKKRRMPRLWFKVKQQAKPGNRAKPFAERMRLDSDASARNKLASGDFICPRCHKVRDDSQTVVVTDGTGASRRVCYNCAHEIKSATAALSKATINDWLPGLMGGLLVAVVCAGAIFVLTNLTHLALLKALLVVGFLVGAGVKVGANNRHGLPLAVLAVITAVVAYGLAAYACYAGVRGGLPSFGDFMAGFGTLQFGLLELASAVLGLVAAFITPYGNLNIFRKQ